MTILHFVQEMVSYGGLDVNIQNTGDHEMEGREWVLKN